MSAPAGSASGARRARWPRSLLGRQWLLVAALVVLGRLCAAWLARQMILRPRADQVAEGVARQVDALRAGLAALPPAQRAAFADAFNHRARQAAGTAAGAAPGARPSPVERTFMQAVERRLAADAGSTGADTAPAGGATRPAGSCCACPSTARTTGWACPACSPRGRPRAPG